MDVGGEDLLFHVLILVAGSIDGGEAREGAEVGRRIEAERRNQQAFQ